jgi:hypothetical protein
MLQSLRQRRPPKSASSTRVKSSGQLYGASVYAPLAPQ